MTKQRKVVYEIVSSSKNHMTAEEIYEKAKKILPNIAIGTEFALGPYFMKGFQTSHTDEYWNGSSLQEQTLLDSPGDVDFYVDYFRPTANFFLMFNF